MTSSRRPVVAVVGAGASAGSTELSLAEEVGRLVARRGAVLLSGGRGGVMEASCRGAVAEGGITAAFLPGDPGDANDFVMVGLPLGVGFHRNSLIAHTADVVVAVGGAWGTISEVAAALNFGKHVVALGIPAVPDHERLHRSCATAAEAVDLALELVAPVPPADR